MTAIPRRPAVRILVRAIRLYQITLSPWIGQHCRFYPSCSHYAIEAIDRHGALVGLVLTGRRLLRCNPWCMGGFDPVPCNRSDPQHRCTTTQRPEFERVEECCHPK